MSNTVNMVVFYCFSSKSDSVLNIFYLIISKLRSSKVQKSNNHFKKIYNFYNSINAIKLARTVFSVYLLSCKNSIVHQVAVNHTLSKGLLNNYVDKKPFNMNPQNQL